MDVSHYCKIFLAIFFLALIQTKAFAEPVGQMLWTKGKVSAVRIGQKPRTLQRRSPLFQHDIVVTGKNSTGEMAFIDNSMVSLTAGTQFRIENFQYKKNPATDKSVMTLIKGGFRTITGVIPKENPDNYKVKTPVATIGVRGTEYTSILTPEDKLVMKIQAGSIDVTNAQGTIQLSTACSGGACGIYGVVSSESAPPQVTSSPPPELSAEPVITPIPDNLPPPSESGSSDDNAPAASGSDSGSGGDSGADSTSTPSGETKTVSGFCIG